MLVNHVQELVAYPRDRARVFKRLFHTIVALAEFKLEAPFVNSVHEDQSSGEVFSIA